jgi:type I restriction enzyme, S subunit
MNVSLAEICLINPKLDSTPLQNAFVDFVPMADVFENGLVLVSHQRKVSEVSKGFTSFQKGDVLVAKITPCYENNKIAVADIQSDIGFGSTEFHVIRCDKNRLDARYLLHLLRSENCRTEGKKRMTGSAGQQRIPKQFLETLQIPLPPLAEQKRIAAILDQADALRRKRKQAIERLNQLGQAIFYEMFGDIRTAHRRFPTAPFGEFADVKLGKMLDKGKFSGVTRHSYLRNANVRWFTFDLSDLSEMEFSEDELERFSVKPGDLMICEGGEPGRCAVWEGDSSLLYYQKALHRARINRHRAIPEFVAFWFKQAASIGLLEDSVTSATIAHLTGEKIKKIEVFLPPISMQVNFQKALDAIKVVENVTTNARNRESALFQTLQSRAFAGTL